jgi:Carboxypeptidase regulatory-like domain
MNKLIKGCLLTIALGGHAAITFAQNTSTGEIRGTVTDASNAVIADATVLVTNTDTGEITHFVTNKDGLYDTVSTPPGHYRIDFSRSGFAQLQRGPITLTVSTITVNAQLRVGSIQEKVVVTTDASLLKTETSDQGTTLDAKTMLQLPQVGQSWENFTILLPGTAGAAAGADDPSNPGIGVSINGTLPYYSNFLADGASVTLPQSANTDTNTFETVAEVNIETSTFSAQYGIGGAVFNQITKSGTNAFHGSGYEYLQNNELNARSYFDDPTTEIPPLHVHVFGGSIGGPILKNKMFFYFNVEKTISNTSSGGFVTIPTLAERGGDFSDVLGGPALDGDGNQQVNPCDGTVILTNQIFDQSTLTTVGGQPCRRAFAGNKIPTIDPVANGLQAYYPAPNQPGLANNYFQVTPVQNPYLTFYGRLDYDITSKNRITFAATSRDNKALYQNEFPCPIDCQFDDVADHVLLLSDTWTISSRLVNEFRFGFNRQGNWFTPSTLGLGIPQKVGLQYAKADILPDISIGGGVGSCCDGLQASANYIGVGNSFDPSDVVTMVRGKHVIHFGGEVLRYQNNSVPYGNVQAGEFGFNGAYTQATPSTVGSGYGYADFLLGEVESWSANNQPVSGARQFSPQMFVQDDYKLRTNLTLNLGLRYQIQSGWSEVHGYEGTFDPTLPNSATGTLGAMWFVGDNGRNQLQKNVYDIFLPRVGFSYSPNGTTVVRGGFGIYSYNWSADSNGSGVGFGSNSYGSISDQTNGLTPIVSLSGTGSNLPYLKASTSSTAYNGQGVKYNPYHTPVAKSYQYSFGIQHQLPQQIVLNVSYVGSHGTGLSFPTNINQVPESKLSQHDNPSGRPYPQFQGISGNTYNAISNYNSLQLAAERRLASGWSFSANYTWSHFLNDQDSAGWGSHVGPQNYQNAYDPHVNYGPSNFDVRHSFKSSAVYQLPFGRKRQFLNKNSAVDAMVGGWQLSITYVAHTGNPFTVTYGGHSLSYAQAGSWRPDLIGNPRIANRSINGWFNPAAFTTAAPATFGNLSRNTIYGPDLTVMNASLAKTFAFTERVQMQVRIDANNALNHPSFGQPDTNFDDPVDLIDNPGRPTGAGTIGYTTVQGRVLQLGARLSF